MTDIRPDPSTDMRQTVYELADALLQQTITDEQSQRLNDLLTNDANARRHYIRFMQGSVILRNLGEDLLAAATTGGRKVVDGSQLGLVSVPTSIIDGHLPVIPPIVVQRPPIAPPFTSLYTPGGVLFSYGVSALVMVVGLLIGWRWHAAHYEYTASHDLSPATAPTAGRKPELRFAGRITGMADCEWANSSMKNATDELVPIGRRYDLASGLVEITYDTGVKIILQGPCTYRVDSHESGYLALGKLTAKVEKKAVGSSSAADGKPSASPNPHSPPSSPASLFVVRTPTAVITDLGTEFAVEVDSLGGSKAHVFSGKIQVRPDDRVNASGQPILLVANQSARVFTTSNGITSLQSESGLVSPSEYARYVPKPVPIKLFNTGLGLKEGEPDPHWQFVVRSDDPTFQPQPARVIAVNPMYRLPNLPNRSQWISIEDTLRLLPDDVVFTLRTTFDLTGLAPQTAILRGRYLVDDHIKAIRLNGRPVPWHVDSQDTVFFNFRDFTLVHGFQPGINSLEIDVLNGAYSRATPGSQSYMCCCIELEGVAVQDWRVPPQSPRNSTPLPAQKASRRE